MGPPLLTVKSGQHVHVTGKTADGTWLRIHYGSAGRAEAWIPASAYQVLGSLDGIPVASCAPEALLAVVPSPTESMTATGTFEPTQVPTTAPTARARRRRPTPRATPTPDATADAPPDAAPDAQAHPEAHAAPTPDTTTDVRSRNRERDVPDCTAVPASPT